jgi:hypothetical protein
MFGDLARQQGASRLQTTSENLWTFSANITSPFRTDIPLRNPIELRNYRVTSIISESSFSSSISSSLSLDLLCILPILACYRSIAPGKYMNKQIKLNYYYYHHHQTSEIKGHVLLL